MLVRLLSIVLFSALFLPQAGQAHVHLCLDGAGPAIEMHTPEPGKPCVHVGVVGHRDHAIEMDSPAIGKHWPPSLYAAVFGVVLVLLNRARRSRLLPIPRNRQAPVSRP